MKKKSGASKNGSNQPTSKESRASLALPTFTGALSETTAKSRHPYPPSQGRTTAVSPFFANLGYDPHWQFDLSASLPNQAEDQQVRSAVKALSEIHDHLRTEMHRAQLHYQETADTHRLPAPDYQVGDLVWLDARNWKTRRPSAKLDHQRDGPFKIACKISSHAFRLELYSSMQVHPVFMCPYLSRQRGKAEERTGASRQYRDDSPTRGTGSARR